MSSYLFLLLVLACPLMMFWMMRGGHGHHSRDELDREIDAPEATGADVRTPSEGRRPNPKYPQRV